MIKRISLCSIWMAAGLVGCAGNAPQTAETTVPQQAAPVIHGEAGVVSRENPATPSAGVATMQLAISPNGASTDGNRPIARITTPRGDRVISYDQLLKPLVEAHGLGLLLQVVQLELAKDQAEMAKVVVTPEDLKAEHDATLGKLYEQTDQEHDRKIEEAKKANRPEEIAQQEKDKLADRKRAVDTLMEQQRITAAELQLLLETNAYLRKVAAERVKGNITDDMLHQEFSSRYNEQVQIKHIELIRGQDVAEVKRRLAAGESFGTVAREKSVNRATGAMDGSVPPFSLANPNLPKEFKEAAFALKPGEVSDPININDRYHIIKAEKRIPPTAVTFEKVRDSLARDLAERATTAMMGQIRAVFGEIARKQLRIEDQVLARQFQEKIDAFNRQVEQQAKDAIRADLERARNDAATRPATQPGNAPEFGPAPVGPAAPTAPATPAPAAPATKPADAKVAPAGTSK